MPACACAEPRTMGERIRQLRQQRRWTMRGLAGMTGLSASTICRFESSKHPIWADDLAMLSKVFGVSMDWLYWGGVEVTDG